MRRLFRRLVSFSLMPQGGVKREHEEEAQITRIGVESNVDFLNHRVEAHAR